MQSLCAADTSAFTSTLLLMAFCTAPEKSLYLSLRGKLATLMPSFPAYKRSIGLEVLNNSYSTAKSRAAALWGS